MPHTRKLCVAITAAVAALTPVGCGIESVAAATPTTEATPTLLTPFDTDDGAVVGDMLKLSCGEGLEPISLPALRSAERVGDTDVRYTSTRGVQAGATYEFTAPLPDVQAVIVTFLKKPGPVVFGYESDRPTALDYRATWPAGAGTEPTMLLVRSLSFSDFEMSAVSITLCAA